MVRQGRPGGLPADIGGFVVEQIISAIVQFLQQGIAAIFKFLELIWTWSFGEIIAIFQSDWKALPIWKLVVLVAVVIAIAYVLYKVIMQLWVAALVVFRAFIELLAAFVAVLPYIVAAGLIAFAGGWVIHNVNF